MIFDDFPKFETGSHPEARIKRLADRIKALEALVSAADEYRASVENYFVKHECGMDLYYQDKGNLEVLADEARFLKADAAYRSARAQGEIK